MLRGLQAMRQKAEEAKSRGGDFGGPSLGYFGWKAGEVKIVRFLTDDVITAQMHEYIMCADGKTRSFLINPEIGDMVAKYASPQPGPGWRQDYKTKDLIERKPVTKSIGVAVLRELKPREGGKGFIVEDALREVEVGGKTYQGRTFGLIVQSSSNFWGALIGAVNLYGTLCDRDYRIERSGSGIDTTYSITPLDPNDFGTQELRDPEVVRQFYGYGRSWKDDDPERFLFCPQTLDEWAEWFSGEERARKLLVPGEQGGSGGPLTAPSAATPQLNGGGFAAQSTDEAQAAPAVEPPTDTDFPSLRERLLAKR